MSVERPQRRAGVVARQLRRCTSLLLACALVTATPIALADDAQARAVALYKDASQKYREGKFAEAAQLLRDAYALSPDPVLLYDLGRACEAMQDLECAVDAYARYLDKGDPPDRGAIAARVENLRKALAAAKTNKSEPVVTPTPTHDEPERATRVAPWIVTGAGIATFTAGVVLVLVADGQRRNAVDDPVQRSAADEQTRAEHTLTAARVTLALGTAVAAAGCVWLLLDRPSSPNAAISSVGVHVGLGGVRLSVSF